MSRQSVEKGSQIKTSILKWRRRGKRKSFQYCKNRPFLTLTLTAFTCLYSAVWRGRPILSKITKYSHYGETWPRSSPSSTRAPERDTHVTTSIRTLAACTAGGRSSKELFQQLINSYSEHLHEVSTCLSPVHELYEHTWTHMDCTRMWAE